MTDRIAILLATLALAGCATPIPPLPAGTDTAARPERRPDVYYEPSPPAVVAAMLALARVGPGDVVYDLGSGDGRIPIAAARDYGARGVGVEIDPRLTAVATANAAAAGVAARTAFRTQDIFKADFRDATVVTLFLFPEVNRRLKPRLLAELAPGTRIVSHYHDMGDWQPERRIRAQGRPLYLWTIPPRPSSSE